jgi:hypothetical protein
MNKYFALAAALSFLFASCATVKNDSREQTAAEQARAAGPSFEEVYDSGHWVTRPSDGVITVWGIAGRRANRDAAIAEALTDAARRVALYHGVRGESASVLNQGSGNLDYFSDFDYQLYLLNNFEAYMGDLVFDQETDVLEKNGAVFVRVRYPGVSNIPAYQTVVEDGVPDWVKKYSADIPGFLTAVSYSRNRGSPQKTYQASYESAIVSLLPRLASKVANDVVDVAGGRVTQQISTSSGVLENVMILETWFDRKSNSVWTLLIAKEKA